MNAENRPVLEAAKAEIRERIRQEGLTNDIPAFSGTVSREVTHPTLGNLCHEVRWMKARAQEIPEERSATLFLRILRRVVARARNAVARAVGDSLRADLCSHKEFNIHTAQALADLLALMEEKNEEIALLNRQIEYLLCEQAVQRNLLRMLSGGDQTSEETRGDEAQ